jgi:hypothetical protein
METQSDGAVRASGSRSVPRGVAVTMSVLSLFAGMVIAGSVAVATASTNAPTYYACLHKGALSKVGSTKPRCPSGYKLISWNSAGPQGQPGATGPGAVYFTSNGTYTVPAGVTAVQITVTGAGGGGGGGNVTLGWDGGGGGQGGSVTVVSDVTAGDVLTVGVGKGGIAGVNDADGCGSSGEEGFSGGGSFVRIDSGGIASGTPLAAASGGGGGGLPCDGVNSGPGIGGTGGDATVIPGETTLSESVGADGTTVTTGGAKAQSDPGVGGGVAGVNGSGGEGGLTTGPAIPVFGSNGFVEIIAN